MTSLKSGKSYGAGVVLAGAFAFLTGCAVTAAPVEETMGVVDLEAEAPSVVEGTSEAGFVARSTFEGTWPFGQDQAGIVCLNAYGLAVELDGGIYALNGVAISAGYEELTLETPNTVWLDNPSTGLKVNKGDFTEHARDFCGGNEGY